MANKNDTEGIWTSGLFLYAEAGEVVATQQRPAGGQEQPRMSRIERIRRG